MNIFIASDHWLLQISWQEWLIAAGILLLFLTLRKLLVNYLFKFILRLAYKTPTELVTNILLSFEKPLRLFLIFLGAFAALRFLPLTEQIDGILLQIFRTIIVIHIAWGLFNLSAASSKVFSKIGEKMDVQFDDILLPFLSKIIRFAVIVMALSIVADEWGYNVSGFVAGLGLGGLAFALAAQDSISNFFGGVIIITEKPFTLGDWIKTPSVEGVVEDISFRSTSVRTFADTLVTVPNNTLAHEPIENLQKMEKRQITFNLGVKYSTPREKISRCVDRFNELLKNHEQIDQELIIVRFTEFNESSLGIFLYFFSAPTAWEEHLQIKEDINLRLMEIMDEEGVQMAFPSRSLYLEDTERPLATEKEGNV
ncbi:mechanosensitive ion channel family protein [Salisediminibacterium halotolerans]|uniref:MscS family membrane protein n=1 Tax=Salisediminibacterium halotolerans TaxID=517425 RepID=A0A1H9WLT6_9BACI|nr:mechanosensitive ion channel family protein [Salisediminibacterium haloalkalitolerans]SES34835.1 MscS family membrane protein [Salisediminibacterium haloalkalitolerans]